MRVAIDLNSTLGSHPLRCWGCGACQSSPFGSLRLCFRCWSLWTIDCEGENLEAKRAWMAEVRERKGPPPREQ